MPNYQYIDVERPDLGLMGHVPPTDIPDRACADCQNVYFWNGEIRKRFGYGATAIPKVTAAGLDIINYDCPITGMAVYSNVLSTTSSGVESFIYAFTTRDVFNSDDATSFDCRCRSKDLDADGTAWTAVSGYQVGSVGYVVGSAGHNLYVSWDNRAAADFNLRIKINNNAPNPDTFIWSVDGGTNWYQPGPGFGFGAEGTALPVNCSTSNIDLTNAAGGGASYCYIRFALSDGNSLNETWDAVFDYGANTDAADAANQYDSQTGVKISVAAAFGYGAIAYRNMVAGEYTYAGLVRVFVKSTVALSLTEWRMGIFDKDAVAGCGVSHVLYPDIAVAANTWTMVDFTKSNASGGQCYPFGFGQAAANWATGAKDLVVELLADKGACDIWLVDTGVYEAICQPENWTIPVLSTLMAGTFDAALASYVCYAWYETNYGYIYYQNATTNAYLADDAADYTAGGTSLNALHRAQVVTEFKNHLLFMRGYETGEGRLTGVRVRWSDLILPEVWNTGTSGYVDLAEGDGWIQNAIIWNDVLYVFETNSIVRCTHLGGETAIFRWDVVSYTEGLKAIRLLELTPEGIIFASHNNIKLFNGSRIDEIGNAVKGDFYDGFSSITYPNRCHAFRLDQYNLVLFVRPVTGTNPDRAWVYDWIKQTWTMWDFATGTASNITAGCSYHYLGVTQSDGAIFGTNEGSIYSFNFTSKNDGSAAIDAYWQSKDFCHPKGGRTEYTDWAGVHFEATGDAVTVSYSTDGGVTWTAVETFTLTSAWTRYYADFVGVVSSQLLRIRFANSTASSTFQVRWFSIQYDAGGSH